MCVCEWSQQRLSKYCCPHHPSCLERDKPFPRIQRRYPRHRVSFGGGALGLNAAAPSLPFRVWLAAASESKKSLLHFCELDVRISAACSCGGAGCDVSMSSGPLKELALLLIQLDLTNSHMGAARLFWPHQPLCRLPVGRTSPECKLLH